MNSVIKYSSFLFIIFSVISCSSSDDLNSTEPSDNFNREAVLTNWADQIIIPAYTDLNSELQNLVVAKNSFVQNPTEVNLTEFRQAWLEAYKVWQHVEMFNVGMAEQINYKFQMNVYPTNVEDISQNISSQSYDLSNVNNNDAVGFPAVEYLLYGLAETNTEILSIYTTDTNAEAHKTYLSDVVDQMKTLTQSILNDWNSAYRDTFVGNTENSATGSINLVVNDYIFYYEKGLRANKIGIPAGNFSNTALPNRVEAYYNDEVSKMLSLEALKAVKQFFNGVSYDGLSTGESLANYLNALDSADLRKMINDQFDVAEAQIESLNPSFKIQIEQDNTQMTRAFDELQKIVVLFKVDMLQVLDISVDYVDADGD